MPPLSVSQLIAEVNTLLRPWRDVWLEGEVTNLTRAGSGHLYFSLKDPGAQIGAVMWATSSRSLKFRVENGQQLIVRGRLTIYEKTGKFQMVVDSAEPAGIGALQLAFEQLKERLAHEGLFEKDRKKPLPQLPQRIAVVTSPTGAAIRDVLHVLGRRFSGLSVQVYPVRVQGATAAREIAAAVRNLSRWGMHDVVIICRGGGSLEDLWAFNEEVVARAVAGCSIPTISGIGHETDFTICDFVADLRAATPSAAAETVIRSRAELCDRVDHLTHRISGVMSSRVGSYRNELRHLASSDGIGVVTRRISATRTRLDRRRQSLDRLLRRQATAMRTRLERLDRPLAATPERLQLRLRKERADALARRAGLRMRRLTELWRDRLISRVGTLEAVSPLSVLARGYAIAYALEGKNKRRLLYDSSTVRVGAAVEVVLKKGRLECTVDRHSMGLESVLPDDLRRVAADAPGSPEENEHGPTPRQ